MGTFVSLPFQKQYIEIVLLFNFKLNYNVLLVA